jgi:predicted transcriptional regulator
VLDDKDLELIAALRSIKVPRNVATLIIFLANANEATSREIEAGTNMRQPEVSIGMRALRQYNWIEQRNINAEGRGHPTIVYKLNVPIEKIIQHYEEEKNRESAQARESIQKLRKLTTA